MLRNLSTPQFKVLLLLLVTLLAAGLAAASIGRTGPTISRNHVVATVLAGHLAAPGPAGTSMLSLGTEEAIVKSTLIDLGQTANTGIPPGRTGGCPSDVESTVRPDQTCTSRRQVSGGLAVDSLSPWHLLAGQNDGRDGYSHCSYYYSPDGGTQWGNGVPAFLTRFNAGTVNDPFARPALPSGHSYDTASDPAVAFDSRGRGYITCAVFDINTPASGIYLSDVTERGVPGPPAVPGGSPHVISEDNNAAVFDDSPALAADWHTGSRFRDYLYVAWSRLSCNADGACLSSIYLSRSSDHGKSWSVPAQVSGRGPVCGGVCDLDQGASVVTGPDGTVYVAFNNANSANPDASQQLLVRSSDGGRSWSPPVRIGDDYLASPIDGSTHPICDLGLGPEQCVPRPTFVRLRDVPRIAINSTGRTLAVVWQDYRSGAGFDENYDVIEATSSDGGATWASRSLFPEPAPGAAQFDPAVSISAATGAIAISYYDRGLNNDLAKSRLDYAVSVAPSSIFGGVSRILASSIPTPLPEDAYPGLRGFSRAFAGPVWAGATILLLWSDGRRLDPNGLPSPTGRLSGPSVIAVPT